METANGMNILLAKILKKFNNLEDCVYILFKGKSKRKWCTRL